MNHNLLWVISYDLFSTPDGDGKEEPKTQKASKQFRAFSDVIEAEEPKWTKREKKNQWHIPLHVFKGTFEICHFYDFMIF